MITLLFVALFIVTVVLVYLAFRGSGGCGVAGFFSGIIDATLLIWVCSLWLNVSTGYTIDQKIEMYEAQNAAIESSIEVTVKSYMDYEERTLTGLKDKDAINLVSLIPELKTDTLVQQQINVYITNNDAIIQLKEDKINLSKDKWLLYFGK